ncbi:hypothetical protein [Phenylobacterium sp.]|uniref:hypothetical protein n=1 Tax=Phenylobacterium sp. TaxID=1871053 RepID=UPI003D275B62
MGARPPISDAESPTIGAPTPLADTGRREGGASLQGIAPHPVVSRASAVFVRNFLQDAAMASGGDFIDAMIRMAITEANVRHVLADDAESRRFAAFDQPVPDDLRRPVSIHGVSTSLSMPFETVRRRVARLTKRDLCSPVPGGLIVTQAQLSTEAMRVLQDRTYRGVVDLYARVKPHAQLNDARDDEPALEVSAPPVRVVTRPALSYVLRYLESAEPVAGSMLDGILLIFIAGANIQHLATPGTDAASDEVVDDALRQPIPVFALARGMSLPAETVRRHVNGLVEQGLCQRDHRGVFVPAAVLRSPALTEHRARNLVSLQRLFAALRRAGVRLD